MPAPHYRRSAASISPPLPPAPWVRTSEPLLWASGSGYEIRAPGYFYDARLRSDEPHVVFQLTLGGAGYFEKNRRRTLLKTGMAFLHTIPGDFRYGFPPEASAPYELIYVSLSGIQAKAWYERIVAAHGHILNFSPAACDTLAPLMRALVQYLKTGRTDRYLASAQLYQLLMTILSLLNQSRLATTPLVTRALDLLHAQARNRAFNVAALAESLECSREHLARQFRAATGVAPSDYLIQHRLRLATQDLRTSKDKLESVAARAGFSSSNYFCRTFRQRLGVTPGEFRQRPWFLTP